MESLIPQSVASWLETNPLLATAVGTMALATVAFVANMIAKYQLIGIAKLIADRSESPLDDFIIDRKVIHRAVQLLPGFLIYLGAPLIPGLPEETVSFIRSAALAYMAVITMLAISAALTVVNDVWDARPEGQHRSIKGYVQLAKILVFCVGAILVVSAILGKSPFLLLSGLGALTAVLLLVFRDTILSLVASVQLSSQDMVRVGDWIEMPQFNADGDVIDVALHTVTVQNFDKTITTIPTHRLISDSYRNWRGMQKSGGRRIKRALRIDMSSVRFLNDDEIERFIQFALLSDYIRDKLKELNDYNASLDVPVHADVNLRRLTNLGTLRAYIYSYLKHHSAIHDGMTLLVRQLPPDATGMPIEIYCFTNTTAWAEYEGIMADIFDHLLAILPEFGLRAYQQPSGADLNTVALSIKPEHEGTKQHDQQSNAEPAE